MNQDELNQKIERIGVRIFNTFKNEGINLDAEDLDEMDSRIQKLIAKHEEVK